MPRSTLAIALGALSFTLAAASPMWADEVGRTDEASPALAFEAIADADDLVPGEPQPAPPRDSRAQLNVQEMIRRITTARRRTENVFATPVAVSTFSARELQTDQVRRTADLNGLVPSLAIDGAVGRSSAGRITLRGVGEGDTLPSTDPGIGLFVDGVYEPRLQGLLTSLYDVERLEVIRGPQGSLFGKNTIGGAINVITKKPQFETGASAEVRIGSEDLLATRFSLNVPLIQERAALRISGATRYDDGFVKNVATDRDLATDRLLAGRAQLLLLPKDDLEVLLSFDRAREPRRTQGGKCVPTTPPQPSGIPPLDAMVGAFSTACNAEQLRSERKITSDASAEDRLVSTNTSARVTWQIGPELELRSTTAYRRQDNDILEDLDGTLVGAGGTETELTQHAFTQEFQLSGSGLGGRLTYVAGLFALSEESDGNTIEGVDAIGNPAIAPFGLPLVDEELKVNNRSFAAFGQLSYAVTERLNLTLGLRRTVERKRVFKRDVTIDIAAGTTQFEFERSKRFSNFSPNASLSYQLTPTILTYAAYGTGFRSGGFNGRADSTNLDIGRISPEKLTSYELGFKSSFLADRLILNVATYYNIVDDLQRPIPTSALVSPPGAPPGLLLAVPVVVVRNAAEARTYGAEVELAAQLAPGLRFETVASSFRNRYTTFDFSNDPGAKDARQPQQPNYLLRFALDYSQDVGTLGAFNGRVSWTHRGQQGNDILDSEAVRSNKYGLLDGRLAFQLPDGKTEIALFGTNLLDREYFNNGLDLTPSLGLALRFQGPPRRYGLEISREL